MARGKKSATNAIQQAKWREDYHLKALAKVQDQIKVATREEKPKLEAKAAGHQKHIDEARAEIGGAKPTAKPAPKAAPVPKPVLAPHRKSGIEIMAEVDADAAARRNGRAITGEGQTA